MNSLKGFDDGLLAPKKVTVVDIKQTRPSQEPLAVNMTTEEDADGNITFKGVLTEEGKKFFKDAEL